MHVSSTRTRSVDTTGEVGMLCKILIARADEITRIDEGEGLAQLDWRLGGSLNY